MSLALLGAGLLLVAVLTAAAASVRSVSRIWLRHWVEERLAGGKSSLSSVEEVQRLLLGAGTAVALVSFANGAVIGSRWSADFQVVLEQTAIAALLILVVGQLIPRAIGHRWATALVPVLVPGLRIVSGLLAPLVNAARAVVIGGSGPQPASAPPAEQEREALEDLLREGELEGVGDAGESAIISGVVDFTGKRVRDVMTPRADVFHVDRAAPVHELVSRVAHSNYSRVPVTNGGLDDVVGLVHVFDVLKAAPGELPPVRDVAFVSEATVASDVLFQMLRERKHLAVVRDATLRTVGLVTLEDLLEELVGDIRDEHDEPVPVA